MSPTQAPPSHDPALTAAEYASASASFARAPYPRHAPQGLSLFLYQCYAHIVSTLVLTYLVIIAFWGEFVAGHLALPKWYRVDLWLSHLVSLFFQTSYVPTQVRKRLEAAGRWASPDDYERYSKDVGYYATRYGYGYEEHQVPTHDGWYLLVNRIRPKGAAANVPGKPVILQHGLLQSSGVFVSCEQQSLAFYLADRGYDVWIGNTRGILRKHKHFSTNDIRFWDFDLESLGRGDFPALVRYVYDHSGEQKVTFVGHSQGNAQAFIGLSVDNSIANYLDLFVALAPAYYVRSEEGGLTKWPLCYVTQLPKRTFYRIFGRKEFIPIMNVVQGLFPPRLFAELGYRMFAYLFHWSDTHWDTTRSPKFFQFTPHPTSAKLVMSWCDAAKAGVLCPYVDEVLEEHHGIGGDISAFSVSKLPPNLNVALFWGEADMLVDGKRLAEQLKAGVSKANLVHAQGIPAYEHVDLVNAVDAPEKVFSKIVELMVKINVDRRS